MFYKISIPSERSGPVAVRFKNRKLLALVMLAPAMCFAADFSHEGISYNLLSDGKIEVCAAEEGSVYTGTISIPRMVQYNGEHRLVAGIGRHAFARCEDLESVALPEGLAYIDDYAFYECENLKTINFPSTLSIIGGRAFALCGSLARPTWPKSLTEIGENAFSYCYGIADIGLLPEYLRIGTGAFSNCTSLVSLDLYNFKGDIGESAFSNCTSLQTLRLNPGLSTISSAAFSDCIQLQEITFPENLNVIEKRAFAGCTSLRKIDIPPLVAHIEERAFAGCQSIGTIAFKTGDLEIGEGGFENLPALKWLYFKGVTKIGEYAFSNCPELEWIEIEDNVEEIGSYAFTNCPKLLKLYSHSEWPPRITINTFDTSTEQQAELLVREDSKERYELAAYWNRFNHISETSQFPLAVESISADPMWISVEHGHIIIRSLGDKASVSDLTGRCIFSGTPGELASRTIPKGIYIVRSDMESRLIMVTGE